MAHEQLQTVAAAPTYSTFNPSVTRDAERGLTVALDFRAQSYDIDFNGHVSNIAYLRWLEDLRLALLDATLPLSDCQQRGFSPVLAETWIRYRRPVHLHQRLRGEIWVGAMEERFFDTHLTLTCGETLVAESRQKLCFGSLETHRAIEIPPAFIERLGR